MCRFLMAAAGLFSTVALFSAAGLAQTPGATPLSFEVASIKPSGPLEPAKIMSGKAHIGMQIDKARVDMGSISLADLIRYAYSIKPYQLSGPDWMNAERFDILAKIPEGATEKQIPEMVQSLLVERFKLAVHRDKSEHAVYALISGKGGPKVKEAAAEPEPVPAAKEPAGAEASPAPGERTIGSGNNQLTIKRNTDGKGATVTNKLLGPMKVSMGEAGMIRMEFARVAMPGLADFLSRLTDRPVIDETGLKGKYEVTLDVSMEEMRNVARAAAASAGIMLPGMAGPAESGRNPAMAASTPSGGSIFTAVQQLGLKLDPRKEPLEKIVVDHVERSPTEN